MTNIISKYTKGLSVLALGLTMGLASCGDYLEIYPENQIAQDKFWGSKEDVASALNAGYYVLRNNVQGSILPWGEQRAGVIYGNDKSIGINAFQIWDIKPTSANNSWAILYQIINQANLVLENTAKAQEADQTYSKEEVASHHAEAYFLRSLAYFYLVRNWKEAPLITTAYSTDNASLQVPKATEAEIIAQIKADLKKAIESGAAKEVWDTNWETKGKATIWSLYALMADVCLWNGDFEECITYCDKVLNDHTVNAPQLITNATHDAWFAMFNPGNSKESIFEIQWNAEKTNGSSYQTNTLYTLFAASSGYRIGQNALELIKMDYEDQKINGTRVIINPDKACRTVNGTIEANGNRIWKYIGGSTLKEERTSSQYDNNFIIYRVADLVMMKAEALVMRNKGAQADMDEAVDIINQLRVRSNISKADYVASLPEMITLLLEERIKEFVAEGKIWYDFLRIARYGTVNSTNLREQIITLIAQNCKLNGTVAKDSKVRSVLSNENAWYLPIYSKEIEVNGELVQNPYYK